MPGLDHYDEDGNLAHSGSTDGTNHPLELGFGPAWRRYITAGIYNGDFASPPVAASPTTNTRLIDNLQNPLPYWTFVQAGGSAMTLEASADPVLGSGWGLVFRLGAGAAGDDAYIEQIVPVNATNGNSYAYLPSAYVSPSVSDPLIETYVFAQYLEIDGTTTTGTANTAAQAGTGAVDLRSAPNTGGQVPISAYYLRVRVGFRRAAAAASATGSVSVYDVRILVGGGPVIVNDYNIGNPLIISQTSGAASIAPGTGFANGPSLSIAGARISVPTGAQTLVAATGIVTKDTEVAQITAASPITLTSTPTLATGTDGQFVTIVNVGANAITLQDQGTLANSNLRLSAATIVLGTRDSLQLLYSAAIGDWIQVGQTNVI